MIQPTATMPPTSAGHAVARATREQFVAHVAGVMASLCTAITEHYVALINQSESGRDTQLRRDALGAFQQQSGEWSRSATAAWRDAVSGAGESSTSRIDSDLLELIGDDVVENKILASRLALAIMDRTGTELTHLRARVQHLEGQGDLISQDVLRPEVVAQGLVESWVGAGLERSAWTLVQSTIEQHMVETVHEAYQHANRYLVSQGVLPEIKIQRPLRRAATDLTINTGSDPDSALQGEAGGTSDARGRAGGHGGGGGSGGGGGQGGGGGVAGAGGGSGAGGGHAGGYAAGGSQGGGGMAGGGQLGSRYSVGNQIDEFYNEANTRMGRARMRAQGILGQLRRTLHERDLNLEVTRPMGPTPGLLAAINQVDESLRSQGSYASAGSSAAVADSSDVASAAESLRERSQHLKRHAVTKTEKATIEIVALMFQSILAEERIPPAVRVWFARLQMPVMRVALIEPEFFSTLHHPARKLIDHMGSCVLGFDSRAISGSALEAEIRRIVQVIEQYPDTGRRVFQLVYDEFQKFLSKYLTEKETSRRVVTLAQQVEQKETLAIQYTIEMRNMLSTMPVREEIREFLFKVWAEVLAVAAIKNGPQHDETIMLKRSASDLVWAASAKPTRAERARVISDLPNLLQRLRQGMALLGLQGEQQEQRIKTLSDTLADAFMSKTETIPQEHIDAMAQRLAHLEDFVIQEGAGDIPLDSASVEMLVGIDASSIVVVADGGSKPSPAMQAWAQELQTGTWYTLDHNDRLSKVQFVWRSDRGQLNLFCSPDGKSYLIQARRLAAYLQAGLLAPEEEEALTVRATRDALEKIEANPERLDGV